MIATQQIAAAPALGARRAVAQRSPVAARATPRARLHRAVKVQAMLGGGGDDPNRKKLTRESEPKARAAKKRKAVPRLHTSIRQ